MYFLPKKKNERETGLTNVYVAQNEDLDRNNLVGRKEYSLFGCWMVSGKTKILI